MARKVGLTVNGKRHTVQSAPDTMLLYVLRNELGLQGPRFGCGLSQVRGLHGARGRRSRRSCIVPRPRSPARRSRRSKGSARSTPSSRRSSTEQAAQCGYCINGMVMQSVVFLKRNPRPTEAQIKKALNANICRCGTHYRIVKAVERAARAAA